MMFDVVDKYDAFRSAQEAGKKRAELTRLSDEFMAAFMKVQESQALSLQPVMGMKQQLHPETIIQTERGLKAAEQGMAEGLEPMFRDEVYGVRLKAAYDDFRKYNDLKKSGKPLTEEENASLQGKSLGTIVREKEDAFLSLWRQTSVRMLKNFKNNMCSTKMKLDKENNFITVMGKISTEKMIKYKSMMKVGPSLGLKIYFSKAN